MPITNGESEEIKNVQRLIRQYQRRLQLLLEKKAIQGLNVDPEIVMEIEDIQAEIESLAEKLDILEKRPPLAEVTLGEDASKFSAEKLEDTRRVVAALLGISTQQIKISFVRAGSVVLLMQLPRSVFERLNQLYQAQDSSLQKLNIQEMKVVENLVRAKLKGVDLSGYELPLFRLNFADLEGADLSQANLKRAELQRANLTRTKLVRADLREAWLQGADLSEADLDNADLRKANLSSANLAGAILTGVKLAGAILTETELDPHKPKKDRSDQEEQKTLKIRLPPYKLLKGDKVWTFWFISSYHFSSEDWRESNLFDEAVKAGIETLVIDLSEVREFRSWEFNTVFLMYKELAQRNINLVLRNPNPTIQRIIRMQGLNRIAPIEFSESQDEEEHRE